MANLKIQLKRNNGTDYDVLHPETEVGQVLGLQTALDNKVSTSALGANNGVATLNNNGKINDTQIPLWLINGTPSLVLVISGSTYSAENLVSSLKNFIAVYQLPNPTSAYGKYFYCGSESMVITYTGSPLAGTEAAHSSWGRFLAGGSDDGLIEDPITLEKGDLIMFSHFFEGTSETMWIDEYYFTIVNNTYGVASSEVHGVVKLSASTSTATTGSNVITDGVLAGLMGTGATQIAKGNHNHDSAYLGINANATSASKWAAGRTITLGGDLTGSVSIDGSQNVTLTATVSDDSHNHTVAKITDLTASAAELNILDGVTASTTEINYVDGVTSAIQTQLDGKQATITGAATSITGSNLTASMALVSNATGKVAASAVTSTELGYLTGVTSAIQTQLNAKSASGHTHDDRYFTETEITNLLTNRPEIYYNTTTGVGTGDYVVSVITP